MQLDYLLEYKQTTVSADGGTILCDMGKGQYILYTKNNVAPSGV